MKKGITAMHPPKVKPSKTTATPGVSQKGMAAPAKAPKKSTSANDGPAKAL